MIVRKVLLTGEEPQEGPALLGASRPTAIMPDRKARSGDFPSAEPLKGLPNVGFMGAYRLADGMDPLLAGIVGSIVTTWVTFVPCFLWIFLGAPYIEILRGNRSLSTALTGITAAVVGVIFNLAVWFSVHTLFGRVEEIHPWGLRMLAPDWSTLDPGALLIAIGAFFALFWWKLGMLKTLALSAAAGLIWFLVIR